MPAPGVPGLTTAGRCDGGVLIDTPDLTFSNPQIAIRRQSSGGCARRCKKGCVCKNGRCKKKH
jgi:hypothetical protein